MNPNNNLSFKAKIKFVNLQEYAKIAHKSVEVARYSDWDIDSARKGRNLLTRYVNICNAGGLQNKKEAFMFHILPLNGIANSREIFEAIKRVSEELGSKCSGVIIGGESGHSNSRILFDILKNIYEKLNIKYSYVWGKNINNHVDDVHFSSKTNCWSIYNPLNSITSPERLKRSYSDIYILPEDELLINGVKIDRKEHPDFFVKH